MTLELSRGFKILSDDRRRIQDRGGSKTCRRQRPVRYYERLKLLPVAPRTVAGFRVFTPDAVERVRFIKQAQYLGFSLEEIGLLTGNSGRSECLSARDLLQAKLHELHERMAVMACFQSTLEKYLAECEGELKSRPDSPECPVVADITRSACK